MRLKIPILFLLILSVLLLVTVQVNARYFEEFSEVHQTSDGIAIRFGSEEINKVVQTNFEGVGGTTSGIYIIPDDTLTEDQINQIATISGNINANVVHTLRTYNFILEEFKRMTIREGNNLINKMNIEHVRLNMNGEPVSGIITYTKSERKNAGFAGCFLNRCSELYANNPTLANNDIVVSNAQINISARTIRVVKDGFIGLRSFGDQYYFYEIVNAQSNILYRDINNIEIINSPIFYFFTSKLEDSETYLVKKKVESIDDKIIIRDGAKISLGKFYYESSKIAKKSYTIKNIFGGTFLVTPFNLVTEDFSYIDSNNVKQICLYYDEYGRAHYNPSALCGIGLGTTEEKTGMSYIYSKNTKIIQPIDIKVIQRILSSGAPV